MHVLQRVGLAASFAIVAASIQPSAALAQSVSTPMTPAQNMPQGTDGQTPSGKGATPGGTAQNSPETLERLSKDKGFVGAEKPAETGAIQSGGPSPKAGATSQESMNYSPSKIPEESTQQPK